MNQESTKSNRIKLAIGVLAMGFFSSAHSQIASPVVSTMATDLGITSSTVIGLLTTLPSATFVLGSLLCGKMSAAGKKRLLMVLGLIVFIVGGAGTALFSNPTLILVFRGIVGVGAGMLIPLGTGIVPDYYEGDKCASMIGNVTAIGGVFGFILAYASGLLGGAYGWRASYLLHIAAIIPIIVALTCLPKVTTVSAAAADAPAAKATGKINTKVYAYAVVNFLMFLPLMTMWSYTAVFMTEKGLGTVEQAGLAISMITLFCFFGSVLFGKVWAKAKGYTTALFIALALISFVLVLTAKSFAMVLIGIAIFGYVIGSFVPLMFTKAAMVAAPEHQVMAASIMNIGTYAGQFCSTFFVAIVLAVTGSTSSTTIFTADVVFLAVALVISLVVAISGRAKEKAAAKG